jgi:hypothetical protein
MAANHSCNIGNPVNDKITIIMAEEVIAYSTHRREEQIWIFRSGHGSFRDSPSFFRHHGTDPHKPVGTFGNAFFSKVSGFVFESFVLQQPQDI